MKIVIFWTLVLVASTGANGADPCAKCPNGELDLNRVVDNICVALSDADSNIVIARKKPFGDRSDTLPIEFIREMNSRGLYAQLFEVLHGLDQREQVKELVLMGREQTGPMHPEVRSAFFHPPEGSEWLIIVRTKRIESDGEFVFSGELYDFFFSCFSRSAENSINTSGDALLEDLRQIQAMKGGDLNALGLKTGIGRMVAEKVVMGRSGTE